MTANQIFYSEIAKLRELFHKYGRFDDSNSKLDEISKYIAIYIYQLQNNSNTNSFTDLINDYEADSTYPLVHKLKNLFKNVACSDCFKNYDNTSIWGNQPTLHIDDKDSQFAYTLIKLVVNSVNSVLEKNDKSFSFDVLNESFGHFIRDNFRNHVEDAQYMTPPEAVELMCNIAINDIKKETAIHKNKDFIVCDPCCGVGSFLSAFYQNNRVANYVRKEHLVFIGQDKVARMARLTKINLMMFNNKNHIISNDNSLVGETILNNYKGQVDLILTNPPFGAKFNSTELRNGAKDNFPILQDLIIKNGSVFNSEILFLDKCLSLLKQGGKLLIILPDSVISSAGLNSVIRHRIAINHNFRIKALIELPPVAFAQAGTRTKTSILYIEKNNQQANDQTFIGICENIGFEVSTRKGATVKIEKGNNDLINIFNTYKNIPPDLNIKEHKVINNNPSCVLIKSKSLEDNSWTPSHYNAARFKAIDSLKKSDSSDDLVRLSDLVIFDLKKKNVILSRKTASVSVYYTWATMVI